MPSALALERNVCPLCGLAFDIDAVYCPADGARLEASEGAPPSDPYIGTLIHGDIELRSVAGAGAMGRVYRAFQRGVDRDVAVKILHRELSGNTQLVQRFHREAKIASKLQHPHVVEVYLVGQLPDGAMYIAMEFLDGLSLGAALAAGGGIFSIERTMPIALQICDAVGEAHVRGVVHRDLKPENVMLVRRADVPDWVKVLDFGIAKVSLGEQSVETAAGLIFGTARYISPEGAQGTNVGPPGDVYSIATIIYQLLAGRTPFDAPQPVGLLVKHIHEAPPDLRSWPAASAVPEPIARVIMENLAKDPTRRAPSARALGNALATAAREANISFADVGVVARMSMELGPASRLALEPTIDDNSQPPPALATAPASAFIAEPTPAPTSASQAGAAVAAPAPRRGPILTILLAFLLGIAVAVLVSQQLGARRATEHDTELSRARRALVEGRYTSPPGNNVRDVVTGALARWPNDEQFLQIKSDTAHELVTRALAARSAGDLQQALDLVKAALEFDSSDHAAAMLVDQYEDELSRVGQGPGSAPKALLAVPIGRARAGQKVEVSARVVVGATGIARVINEPRFTITGAGLPAKGLIMPAGEAGPAGFRSTFVAPREASYEVVFEANADGVPLRAERTLDVTK